MLQVVHLSWPGGLVTQPTQGNDVSNPPTSTDALLVICVKKPEFKFAFSTSNTKAPLRHILKVPFPHPSCVVLVQFGGGLVVPGTQLFEVKVVLGI